MNPPSGLEHIFTLRLFLRSRTTSKGASSYNREDNRIGEYEHKRTLHHSRTEKLPTRQSQRSRQGKTTNSVSRFEPFTKNTESAAEHRGAGSSHQASILRKFCLSTHRQDKGTAAPKIAAEPPRTRDERKHPPSHPAAPAVIEL